MVFGFLPPVTSFVNFFLSGVSNSELVFFSLLVFGFQTVVRVFRSSQLKSDAKRQLSDANSTSSSKRTRQFEYDFQKLLNDNPQLQYLATVTSPNGELFVDVKSVPGWHQNNSMVQWHTILGKCLSQMPSADRQDVKKNPSVQLTT